MAQVHTPGHPAYDTKVHGSTAGSTGTEYKRIHPVIDTTAVGKMVSGMDMVNSLDPD